MKPKLLVTASVWRHIRNFHLPYLARFRQLGWETHVGCAGIPADAPHVDVAIELPFEKRMTSPANFRATRMLMRRMREERYDLVITHTTLAAFFTRLALGEAFPGPSARRPRLVNVMHGYLFDDDTPALKRGLLLGAERLTARWTDLLLVMNDWDYHAANRYHLGARVEMIPGMGVDFSGLDAATDADGRRLRKELGIAEHSFVMICAAEFSDRKCQSVLIRAMASLPERATLVLCGEGATLEACRALAAELGVVDRVRFPGQVADMPAWYRMADACVAASRSEGLPFNLMEALRAGLPVVASATKGHTDLVEDGVNGFLYPWGDADALAERMKRLMDDDALTARLSGNAPRGMERFSRENVLSAVMKLYLSALGE